jgi:hypothetical protein
MQSENFKMNGHITFEVIRDGEIVETREVKNLIVNAGKAAMAGLCISDVSVDTFDAIAIGTGTDAVDVGDTTLETEITTNGGQRRSGANVTGTRVTTSVTNDTAQLVTTFTFTGGFAITESGIFNHATAGSGDLLARQVFAAINVASGDSLQMTWKIQFS